MNTPNRSETFGRLLKAGIASIANCEGKTAPAVEEDLGQLIGIAGKSIQRYKAGYLPPDPRTVQILAEACVRRGMMAREWLEAFLHHARYHQADRLIEQLRPLGPVRPRPPRVYENLPAPTYSQFVMREQAFAEVIDGLQQRSAAVLIVGMGGNGKTSLAREVAAQCLRDDNERTPRFDAVVWVSDKDRPGTTNLSVVLDEIARTLDYPGFTQFEHDEKRREVEQLLRRQHVLLVVDNFETITDGALLAWLLRLPEPSKALITSREKHRGLWGSWLAELRGMSAAEAEALITQRLRALQLSKIADDPSQFEPLITVTGGNPKAIEMALGLIKHERRPLQQVVDDLYAARGEIFADLFTRAWSLLDEAARRVLLVATFFPTSASGEALSASADVQGFAFDRAVERLADLALLDRQQTKLMDVPRYALHPLVRAFAGMKLIEQQDFEAGARQRWAEWYIQFAAQVGYCWYDLNRLDMLDPEYDSLHHVVTWCSEHRYHSETLRLVREIFFYYHVRGFWHRQPSIFMMAADSAMCVGDQVEEIRYLSMQIKFLIWQDNTVVAEALVTRLLERKGTTRLPDDVSLLYRQAVALHYMALKDYASAQRLLEDGLQVGHATEDKQTYNASKHWLATCHYYQGNLQQAQQLLQTALEEAAPFRVQRATFAHPMRLIQIDLDLKDLKSAEERILQIRPRAYEVKDRRYIALIQHLFGRLSILRGDLPAARAALAEAIDLFERLGMRRELAEARAELAKLDSSSAPVSRLAEG